MYNLKKVNQQPKKPTSSQKPLSDAHKAHLSKQQKLRTIQQSIANKELNSSETSYSAQNLSDTFQIAHELLESVTADSDSFSSATAQRLLAESGKELIPISGNIDETEEERMARQAKFDLLSRGRTVSYKKMLEYLSSAIGFKVNYQSLLGVRIFSS